MVRKQNLSLMKSNPEEKPTQKPKFAHRGPTSNFLNGREWLKAGFKKKKEKAVTSLPCF